MLVCVCGAREWTNRAAIERELRIFKDKAEAEGETLTVMHGGARGADTIAGEVAVELGLNVKVYPARWDTLGKSAGMMRNQHMIDLRPDVVLAFTETPLQSRGTRDMVRRAVGAGILVGSFKG